MVMVRKQVYIEPEQEQKLRRLAAEWDCTEAQVVRKALDQLPDPNGTVLDRLEAAGLRIQRPSGSARSREEIRSMLDQLDRMFEGRPSLHLTEAVIEDRQAR